MTADIPSTVPTDKQPHRDWTYNAETSGKQLASQAADWSPHHDVTVVKKKNPRDQLGRSETNQVRLQIKVKAWCLNK